MATRPRIIAGLVAVAAVAVAAAALGWWLLSGEEAPATGATPPFTLSATVRVASPREGETISEVEWAYLDSRHWRWTIRQRGGRSTTGVADGERVWLFSGTENEYWSDVIPDIGDNPPALPASLILGPTGARDMQAAKHRLLQDGRFEHLAEAGDDRAAGRPCRVLVAGPTWHASAASAAPAPGTSATSVSESSGGEARMCVDLATYFVLRYAADGFDQATITAEVESFVAGSARGPFRFEPPPGSHERAP